MRSLIPHFALTLALGSATPLGAVVVDRIAVIVANQIITSSDIETRLRLSAFENGAAAADFSLAARRTALQSLIDQRLVGKEMELGHYPRLEAAERARLVSAFAVSAFTFAVSAFNSSMEEMDRALARAGLQRKDLEEDLARQAELLTFLSLRFRPAVQISDADIDTRYRERTGPRVPLDEVRQSIEQSITAEQADRELDAWLAAQRKSTRIVFVDRDLQ